VSEYQDATSVARMQVRELGCTLCRCAVAAVATTSDMVSTLVTVVGEKQLFKDKDEEDAVELAKLAHSSEVNALCHHIVGNLEVNSRGYMRGEKAWKGREEN
jgi:hypothetical protein